MIIFHPLQASLIVSSNYEEKKSSLHSIFSSSFFISSLSYKEQFKNYFYIIEYKSEKSPEKKNPWGHHLLLHYPMEEKDCPVVAPSF